MTRARIPLSEYVTEYSVRNKADEDIPVYSVTNSQGFCTEYFGKEVASKDKTTYKIVPRGYFAYNPSRINVGSIDWQRHEDRVIVSPLYTVFAVSDKLDKQYLYYFLRSDIGRQMIQAKAAGSVRDNLKIEMLKEMTVPDMTVDEQRRCAAVLDRLHGLIVLRQQQLASLDTLIKARFVELFGDSKVNPYGFNKVRLEDSCEIVTGNTPSRTVDDYYGDYIEWIKTDNITAEMMYPTRATESLSEVGLKVGRYVEKGAILMACIAGSVASIGKVCITDRQVAFNQQINAIVPKKYNALFLYVLLQASKDYLVEELNMALKGILSKSKLGEKTFILPPMDQQNDFADFVAQVEKSKAVVQKALDEAQTLFDSLMQQYFG